MRPALPPAARQWAWFVGLWAAGVIGLALAAGALRLMFNLILR